jgi:3,4-dihydroxy 2-butanone 4-phosphate synthase
MNSSLQKLGTTNGIIWRPKDIVAPRRSKFAFDSIEDALAAFAAGEFLVVMDDENRENEGDLIIAASHCTTEKMAWMIKHTRYAHLLGAICSMSLTCENFDLNLWMHSGYICIALPGSRLEELDIPMMVPENQDRLLTAYTVTVDYKHGKYSFQDLVI